MSSRSFGWTAFGARWPSRITPALRFREPVYRTLRELVMSYFEHYYNLKGEKTLRAFSRPVNLTRFDHLNWMTAEEDVWEIPEYLTTIPHTPILQTNRRMYMDKRLYEAGLLGQDKGKMK